MPETQTAIADIHMLDRGYSREARSLLYQAYRHEPTFGYLFEAERPGYEQRVRATVRELVKQHFLQDLARHRPAGQRPPDRHRPDRAAATPFGHHRKLGVAFAHGAQHRFSLHPPLSRLPRRRHRVCAQ